MASMNMRELRDTRKLKAWLRAGKTVELRDRDAVIGTIVPEKREPEEWPDFHARHREIFGGQVFSAQDFERDRHGRY
ncbi:hypothetical protein [Silvibacterium sp.]|uniref:hypothetical protein n=1 Tax=Silvibacterium sp. TaxID=1964179 RepID=UPI0039E4F919